VSRRLPASKRCDGQGGLRSVVRVAIATSQLQKAATNAVLLSSRIPEAWRIVYIIVRYASNKNSSSDDDDDDDNS
jgi:hypothetical protein